jgi:hypothetical protein
MSMWFMYRNVDGCMMIGDAEDADGELFYFESLYNRTQPAGGVAPTDLPSGEWLSDEFATLESQYASAERDCPGSEWVRVPAVRITAVYGMDDDDPTMAAALRQLAAYG